MLHSNLLTQHVFIVGSGSMFEDGITRLLIYKTGLQISVTKYINDLWFMDAVVQNQPDVLLVIESDSLDSNHLLELLTSTPLSAELRVMVMRFSDLVIDVYEIPKWNPAGKIPAHRQFTITSSDELVALVRGYYHQM